MTAHPDQASAGVLVADVLVAGVVAMSVVAPGPVHARTSSIESPPAPGDGP